jgi:squalene-hopene/tetraprenyl-beta-curcumene cyclase
MPAFAIQVRYGFACILIFLASPIAGADEKPAAWNPSAAAKYLDDREKTWLEFAPAKRGQGTGQTSCVSCHSVLPYVLARPVLRKQMKTETATEHEDSLLARTRKRVENWQELDTPKFRLFYDFDEQKKKESWGTEAVLNAVILAFDDHYCGKSAPCDVTRQALDILWKTQIQSGSQKGSWDWLDFGMEPWEAKGGRYYGAALAALAVGTVPGYANSEAGVRDKIALLRAFLNGEFPGQNLFNQVWCLWASTKLDGVLTRDEQKKLIARLFGKQLTDGGWSLASLGTFTRQDGTSQDSTSDGYATGFVLHVVQTAGVPMDEPKLAKGLAWLKCNQATSGEWRSASLNKKRDPATHVGKFMTDAATAFAVLALSH